MKTAVAWVKDALASKDIVQHLTCYLVRDGMIYASDGRMTAAHPFPHDGPFLVPGAQFEKSLAAMPVDTPVIAVKDGHIEMKHGRFRSRIAVSDVGMWPFDAAYEGEFMELPNQLFEAVKKVRPFVSDNATQPWATAIGLVGAFAYATNNIVVSRAPFVGDELSENMLLPSWVADFVLARIDGIARWAVQDQFIVFQWANGAWLRASGINGTFPARAGDMIERAAADRELAEITPEWREAFTRVVDLCKTGDARDLALYEDRIVGGAADSSLEAEDAAETPLPPGQKHSLWNASFLAPVIAEATHWDPTAWPAPAPWQGDGVEGIVAGRREQGS